jgi:hypothetical protein
MFRIKKTYNTDGVVIQLNLPRSRTNALSSIMPNMSSRTKIKLSEATQEQMGLLFTLKHPAIEKADDTEKTKTKTK